ncbi:PIM2 kinase, partial [Polypterus senegalus]
MQLVSRPPACPAVIQLLDWVITPSCVFLVMERPDPCMDLFDFMWERGQCLTEPIAGSIFRQVVQAVHHCQSRGVLHRDIKPENILVETSTQQTKLIDFGCGTLLNQKEYTSFTGTHFYAPPEWCLKKSYEAEPATVWSLGVLLFEMLCGQVPFKRKEEVIRCNVIYTADISKGSLMYQSYAKARTAPLNAYPFGVPEDQVLVLQPIATVASVKNINNWNITKLSTLKTLLNTSYGSWTANQQLSVLDVKRILGEKIVTLPQYESNPVVQQWIDRQPQSALTFLNLNLTGGLVYTNPPWVFSFPIYTPETFLCDGVDSHFVHFNPSFSAKLETYLASEDFPNELCEYSIDQYACSLVTTLTASNVASLLNCTVNNEVTYSKDSLMLFFTKVSGVLASALDEFSSWVENLNSYNVASLIECIVENKVNYTKAALKVFFNKVSTVLEPALDIYSKMSTTSSTNMADILDVIGEMRLNCLSDEDLSNVTYMKTWFAKLQAFLTFPSADFLSCLGAKNLTYDTYQVIVSALNSQYPSMSIISQQRVYNVFIKPSLIHLKVEGLVLCSGSNNTEQNITANPCDNNILDYICPIPNNLNASIFAALINCLVNDSVNYTNEELQALFQTNQGILDAALLLNLTTPMIPSQNNITTVNDTNVGQVILNRTLQISLPILQNNNVSNTTPLGIALMILPPSIIANNLAAIPQSISCSNFQMMVPGRLLCYVPSSQFNTLGQSEALRYAQQLNLACGMALPSVDNATNLLSLGSLVQGLPSSAVKKISPDVAVNAGKNPTFVANMLAAPSSVQIIFISQIINANTSNILQNVPDSMSNLIPMTMLTFSKNSFDTAQVDNINKKNWSPDQAAMFFTNLISSYTNYSSLSANVLQGFSSTTIQGTTANQVVEIVKACKQKNAVLKEDQLMSMVYYVNIAGSIQNFTSFPPNMLLYYKYTDVQNNCVAYFQQLGNADFAIISPSLTIASTLLTQALACLSDIVTFLGTFLPQLKSNKVSNSLIVGLFQNIFSTSPRARRGAGCTVGNITLSIINSASFPASYDSTQFSYCLDPQTVQNNLAALASAVLVPSYQLIVYNSLKQAYPSGIPESQLQLLRSIARQAPVTDINTWNITSQDTLTALLNPADGAWNASQSGAIIARYLSVSNNALDSTAINAIGGNNLCSATATQLAAISSTEMQKVSPPLDVSSCPIAQKQALYTVCKQGFSNATSGQQQYYTLIKSYLGGAPLNDILQLANNNVSMSIPVFSSLDPAVLQQLNASVVKSLLGSNLGGLATFQNTTAIQNWIQSRTQAELASLGIGLTGGSTGSTASPSSSTSKGCQGTKEDKLLLLVTLLFTALIAIQQRFI